MNHLRPFIDAIFSIFLRFPLRWTFPVIMVAGGILLEGYTMNRSLHCVNLWVEDKEVTLAAQDLTQLQRNIEERMQKGDMEGVKSLITNRGSNPDLNVMVLVDDAGIILGSTDLKLIGTPVTNALPDIDAALMKEAGSTRAGKVFLSEDRMSVTAYYPVVLRAAAGELRPTKIGTIHARFDLKGPKIAQYHVIKRQALITLTFYTVSILIFSLFLYEVFTRRVSLLVDAADRFAAGDFSAHADLRGKDEFAQIAEAFNRMAEEIAIKAEELRKSNIMFRVVADNTYDLEIWMDPEGQLIYISPSCKQFTGYSREDFFSEPVTLDLFRRMVHPDDLEDYLAHLDYIFQHKEFAEMEFRFLRADGTLRWIHHVCQPVYDEKGVHLGRRSSNRDITERKEAEEALHRSEQKLALHLQQTMLGVIEWDTNFVIREWNRAAEKLFGFRRDETVGRPGLELIFTPDKAAETEILWNQISRQNGERYFTYDNITRDGRAISCEWFNTRLKDNEGVMSLVWDVTEQKKTEKAMRSLNEELERRVMERTDDLDKKRVELLDIQRALMNIVEDLNENSDKLGRANQKLKELDRLKSMFIASMSHELRTPLNSIIGFSSILLDEWIGPVNAEQKENLATILRSGRHLLNLINDVIDVSKIEAGKVESFIEEFDLREMIAEAVNMQEKAARDKGLAIVSKPVGATIRTDRRRLLQCVLNMISNAVKYTIEGSVTVEARIIPEENVQLEPQLPKAPGDYVEISVEDSGIGIKEEDLAKIFQPFTRIVSPLQAMVPGTGLGLYLSKKLVVEILKGDMTMSSEYGNGSRFSLIVPVRLPS